MPFRRLLLATAFLVAMAGWPASAGSAGATGTPLATTPLKLSITQEGIYRLSYAYLQTQGIDLTNVAVATLGLSDGGVAVPMYVSSAGATFSPGDYVEFYAHPVNNTYNSTNVYVLADNVTSPARAATAAVSTASSPLTVGSTTYYDAQRTMRWATAPVPAYSVSNVWPSDGDGHWYETGLYVTGNSPTTSVSISFSLHNLATSGSLPCTLTAPVTGLPIQSTSSTPTHQLAMTITDASGIDHPLPHSPYTWQSASSSGPAPTTVSDTFPCSWLIDNNLTATSNRLTVSTTVQSGTSQDEVFLQAFHIGYGENLCAQTNQLQWQGPPSGGPTGSYTISGFSAPPQSIWRLTGGSATVLTGYSASANNGGPGPCNASGTYAVSFADTPSGSSTYYASAAPLTPASIAPLDQTDITSGAAAAQFLIITHPLFQSGLGQLVSYHRGQGLTVNVVNVNTIFDQFSNGQVNPEGIRSYITYAQQHLGTQYVLLVGGDTYDYHNYYRCPASGSCASTNPTNLSFIPSLYVTATYAGQTSSDNLLAVPVGATTDSPNVAIGRFPVTTTAQLQTAVTKTVNWDQWGATNSGTAAFAAGYEDPVFQSASTTMISNLPASFQSGTTTYYENGDSGHDQTNRASFIKAFNTGPEVVNYTGHGNLIQWSATPVFRQSDVASLTNAYRPSLVFQWGCQTSDYTEPLAADIDVSLLTATDSGGRPDGAALTVGSTGLDIAYPQAVLAGGESETGPTGVHYFFGYLAQGLTVGVALERAKDDLLQMHPGDQNFLDVVNSYELIGDPGIKLAATRTGRLNAAATGPASGSPAQGNSRATNPPSVLGPTPTPVPGRAGR